ncbi:hypothetical protein N0V93_005803 [Gnomoniopsis smithogilvyi]|uniref:Kinetochore-associated protein MTW1 n=1 Tax=Gnomoniopsis smithogilvyi TaxID=1191159 RepID=A0A9W9CXH0_9PEZI|nr:hypothetical protein N0V93_005803 [Gnomoniopsis smithogilvyi]
MTEANTDTELLTEHFGYPPVSLLDEIINSINIISERGLTSVETSLLNAPPASLGFGKPALTSNTKSKRKRKQPDPPPEDAAPALSQEEIEDLAQKEIASGTHQLETLLCTSIDRNFDKFEIYVMRNILCVQPEDRDWMRLGHYEGLNFDNLPTSILSKTLPEGDAMDLDSVHEDSDVPTLDSVNRLRRRLQASQKLNTMLLAEKTRNAALLTELRALAGRAQQGVKNVPPAAEDAPNPPLAFLHDKGDLAQADAATPLTTTTAFALSQLQALRALGMSLGNVMPGLGPKDDAGSGRRTWRKERVEYVESAARRHLESVRGLELGTNGEVRDGEWQGEGRRVGSAEVGALESVAEMLGEAGQRKKVEDDIDDQDMDDGAE